VDTAPLVHRARQVTTFGARVYDLMTSQWECPGCRRVIPGGDAYLLPMVHYLVPDDLRAYMDETSVDALENADPPTCDGCGAPASLARLDYHAYHSGLGKDLVFRYRPGLGVETLAWSAAEGFGPLPPLDDEATEGFARDSLYRGACAARERNDPDDADALLLEAADKLPGDPRWLEFLPWLSDRGKFSVAGAIAGAHADAWPDAAEGYFWLGQITLELVSRGVFDKDRLSEAQGYFDQALEREPGHAFARLGLANVARLRGQLDQAKAVVQDLLLQCPEHPEALYTLALVELVPHPDRALALFEQGAKLRPADPDFLRGMGRALLALGRSRDAHAIALRAKQLGPEDTRVDELILAALAVK
jgi:tetratricopeptide (TPR) repeat protein